MRTLIAIAAYAGVAILAAPTWASDAPLVLEGKIPLGQVRGQAPAAIWIFKPGP